MASWWHLCAGRAGGVPQRIMAGVGAYPLVGTAATIAAQLISLSDLGLDGMLLSWADYADGMTRFNAGVLPLLEQAGLRSAHV